MHSSAPAALSENDECQERRSPPAVAASQPVAMSTGLSPAINIYQSVHAEGITAAPCCPPLICLYCQSLLSRRLSLATPPPGHASSRPHPEEAWPGMIRPLTTFSTPTLSVIRPSSHPRFISDGFILQKRGRKKAPL